MIRTLVQDPLLTLLEFLCCVVIELSNLKDPIRLKVLSDQNQSGSKVASIANSFFTV